MELTPELKRRFCKNCNIPISIFVEPFFTDRIKLFSMYYNTMEAETPIFEYLLLLREI